MRIQVAKRFSCEVEVYNGDKLVDKYVAKENDLVTKNPLGHRPQKDIEIKTEVIKPVKWQKN